MPSNWTLVLDCAASLSEDDKASYMRLTLHLVPAIARLKSLTVSHPSLRLNYFSLLQRQGDRGPRRHGDVRNFLTAVYFRSSAGQARDRNNRGGNRSAAGHGDCDLRIRCTDAGDACGDAGKVKRISVLHQDRGLIESGAEHR